MNTAVANLTYSERKVWQIYYCIGTSVLHDSVVYVSSFPQLLVGYLITALYHWVKYLDKTVVSGLIPYSNELFVQFFSNARVVRLNSST